MNPNAWSVFHDGCIEAIRGTVPGDLVFVVDCDYIRQQMPADFSYFEIRVKNCSRCAYVEFDSPNEVTDLQMIASTAPQICRASSKGGEVEVYLVSVGDGEGFLYLRYESEQHYLDNGEPITLKAIGDAANRSVEERLKEAD